MSMETWRLTILAAALTVVVAIWHYPVPVPDSVFDYCSVPCVNYSLPNQTSGNNTACWYAKCPRQPNVIELPWDFHSRNVVLEYHNYERRYFAQGGRSGGKRADMMLLSYDIELEFLVACWLNRGLPQLDQCRSCKRWPYVSQSILTYTSDDPLASGVLKAAIYTHWLGKGGDEGDVYKSKSGVINMIWARISHIGCYVVGLNDSDRVTYLMGCNYAPGGLIPGKEASEKGDKLNCPNGTKPSSDPAYSQFCGEVEYWPLGSEYVGNVLLEERKAYWERDANRVKNGEEDYSAGTAVTCDFGKLLTLLFYTPVISKLLTKV